MSYTKDFALTQDAWTLLIDGQTSGGFVQLKDKGPVLVAVAGSAPAVDSTDALLLDEGGIKAISFSVLEASDKVYGRCAHAETNTVAACATGTAPA